jgi:hypothetical protein
MVRNQHGNPGVVAIAAEPTPNGARRDSTDLCEPLYSRAQRTASLLKIVQQHLSLSRLCQRLLGRKYQIGNRSPLLKLFDAARRGLANPFGETRHVNGTGFAATTHVREYERGIRFRTS